MPIGRLSIITNLRFHSAKSNSGKSRIEKLGSASNKPIIRRSFGSDQDALIDSSDEPLDNLPFLWANCTAGR